MTNNQTYCLVPLGSSLLSSLLPPYFTLHPRLGLRGGAKKNKNNILTYYLVTKETKTSLQNLLNKRHYRQRLFSSTGQFWDFGLICCHDIMFSLRLEGEKTAKNTYLGLYFTALCPFVFGDFSWIHQEVALDAASCAYLDNDYLS